MNENKECKQLIAEVIEERLQSMPPPKPRKMEFSKKIMLFTSAIYLISWGMAAYYLVVNCEIPWELIQYANLLYGASGVSYCGKSAYENKAKIDKWGGDGV